MADKANDTRPDEYTITFRNDALQTLRRLAARYNIPENQLDQLIAKALAVLELPEDDKLSFKKGGDQYFVNLKDV